MRGSFNLYFLLNIISIFSVSLASSSAKFSAANFQILQYLNLQYGKFANGGTKSNRLTQSREICSMHGHIICPCKNRPHANNSSVYVEHSGFYKTGANRASKFLSCLKAIAQIATVLLLQSFLQIPLSKAFYHAYGNTGKRKKYALLKSK